VTGGGSGMGRAMAVEFARLGAAVVVAGRRQEPLAETVALIEAASGQGLAQPTDVRVPEQVDALVAAALERFGRLDVLVNDAAGNFVVKAEELSPNGWRAVTSIVLDGGFLCARAAGRQMIAQGAGAALWPTPADEARVAASVPAGRLATVQEIAWWSTALCSRQAAYITGENLTIDGGHWLEQEGYMPALRPPER